jgi:8-oxo-dGTP diphosphatase
LPKLGYDHKNIINVSKKRLENKIIYTNIAQGILKKEFTLTELQEVYEIILERKFDKRNFRKKILSLGILKELKKKKTGISRPASLYRFSSEEIQEYNIIK